MKKMLPTIALIAIMFLGYRMMFSGNMSPLALIGLSAALFAATFFMRPKKNTADTTPEAILDALGEYGKDAFSDESQLSQGYQRAVANFLSNMPKAAITKLEKIAPQCRNNQERYAVSMVTAMAHVKLHNYEAAIPEYNRAVVLNPTSNLALTIGSCQQRVGQLRKARDSYEFALELDPQNLAALSALATAWVASENYNKALEYAELALEIDETDSSALATTAICHGLLGHPERFSQYADLAERQGYSRKKIDETIKALRR
jgi:tetratricopeptide (TPR) repeat protein